MPAISQAMSRIGYDAGAILPSEAAFLKSADAPLPAGFTVLGDKPATAVLDKGGVKVGIVFFPAPADLTKPTPPAVGDAVAEAAKKLRPSVSLVIGVSGIGMIDEEAFLAAHPGVLDVLLGSGLNAGTAGRPGPGGKTLFARAYTRGKTVNRLDLYQLPSGPDFAWKPNENFKAEVVNLDEAYPADPEIKKLFE
ncbi:MAG: hypothetical protein B193_1325 [Solidesulfovibrio magneticus str. Maddingley MBC34]|uniref:Uncharacterized protein n=1 Tax=Solidesulfovibrio magneticus str. Maddingley MBC34 TaxID=1206767 RepID=K6GSQ7_9BACT|nr:MAG: hypothetical protein B193_1325 [Solidesulfovibrio magneticus str. Maddingley MBC34]